MATTKNDQQENSKASDHRIKKLEAWNGLIKALAWPVIVLVVLIVNCNSIKNIFSEIPNKLRESDKISVGSLSFEISKKAKQIGDPELGELTRDLTGKAIEILLETGNIIMTYAGQGGGTNEITFPSGQQKEGLLELQKKGLLTFSLPLAEYEKQVESMKPQKNETTYDPDRAIYTFETNLLTKNRKYIESQSYRLTDNGNKAFRLVIEAVKSNVQKEKKEE